MTTLSLGWNAYLGIRLGIHTQPFVQTTRWRLAECISSKAGLPLGFPTWDVSSQWRLHQVLPLVAICLSRRINPLPPIGSPGLITGWAPGAQQPPEVCHAQAGSPFQSPTPPWLFKAEGFAFSLNSGSLHPQRVPPQASLCCRNLLPERGGKGDCCEDRAPPGLMNYSQALPRPLRGQKSHQPGDLIVPEDLGRGWSWQSSGEERADGEDQGAED